MNQHPDYTVPLIDSILIPSDFSAGSQTAFHHALKAAIIAKSKLTILHVATGSESAWTDFPGVRETLERWGLLPPHSPRSAVPELGIDVRKVVGKGTNPVKSVLHYLETNPADLIVLATHTHQGQVAWLQHSVAEPISRESGQMTLFIPDRTAGFVSAKDGSVSLQRILIPIAAQPDARPAIAAAAHLAARLEQPRGTFTLLHLGDADSMPAVPYPEVPGWEWNSEVRRGDVIQGIVDQARQDNADLIVMSTDGRNGFLDGLRGSHSERVLHNTPCPLLIVPETSLAAGALA